MSLKNLTSKDTLIVLTFAKAGLGHMRVAYALMEALPKNVNLVLFSSLDTAATFMHRITSINPFMRELGEAVQYGLAEHIFTALYIRVLRLKAKNLLPQFEAVLTQTKAKRIVFVCTHFGLAHQIGELKATLAVRGIQIRLSVVVTDDSPQRAWRVPEADLTIVPSKLTQARLAAPASKAVHYPLSLKLGRMLDSKEFEYRLKQVQTQSKTKIKVCLPVSGAAVGLNFYYKLACSLFELNRRFCFYIVSRDSKHTKPFLDNIKNQPYANVYSYKFDRDVVLGYVNVILKNTIAFEVTKPSEQAFKALYSPKQAGGVILLLTSPVGRQEYDNLWYLSRNNFIPNKEDQERLWRMSSDQLSITNELLKKARNWRGVRLLSDPKKSARFIAWCLKQGIFSEMLKFAGPNKSKGVLTIWKTVDSIV